MSVPSILFIAAIINGRILLEAYKWHVFIVVTSSIPVFIDIWLPVVEQ